MRIYTGYGHSYLVCPRLLELDQRHGEHWSKGPPCRRGKKCQREHDHEAPLLDLESHTVNDYSWVPGNRPHEPHEHPTCDLCGRPLVHSDLDDLYGPEHVTDAAVWATIASK